MNAEKWIWLELFAFDPDMADCGMDNYLKSAGFTPDGVSLLLNAIDFVLLYGGMEKEYQLFDEVNGRGSGHKRWTNYRLRQLVRELKSHGIKVFFSVFTFYWMNKSRKEFIAQHPECAVVHCEQGKTRAVDVLARLDDGRYLENIFAENLYRVLCDYQFSGWHGPDWFGPGGSLKGSCSDNLARQFAEYLGGEIPDGLELATMDKPEGLKKRVAFIMENYHLQWIDFLIWRWERFWRKMCGAVQRAGCECMVNSPQTRSAWESSVSSGMDYRRLAALGVDYLLVETVAANFDLCSGTEIVKDRMAIYNAVLQELKMTVPGMKLIFLHCIKDAGESYDVLRHASGELEQEFFRLSNLFYSGDADELRRCADGFMVCLGNTVASNEWELLKSIWQYSQEFSPVKAGDFIWLFDYDGIQDWRLKHLKYGTPSSSALSAHLSACHNLHSPVIRAMESLDTLNYPAAMFNFDCSCKKMIEKLLNYKNTPLLLLGNIRGADLPENAVTVTVMQSDADYQFGGIILNSGCPPERIAVGEPVTPMERYYASMFEPFPSMKLPKSFWDAISNAWRKTLDQWHGPSRIRLAASDDIRFFTMHDATDTELLAICSYAQHYIAPELHFASDRTIIRKASLFPEFNLLNLNGKLWAEIPYTPPNIPPRGIMVLEMRSEP
ncbi:MAG: hypothetical protein IJS15_04060 [Victivallales bacterium]|nr:hypothetical protein [Victivallales bacterium]